MVERDARPTSSTVIKTPLKSFRFLSVISVVILIICISFTVFYYWRSLHLKQTIPGIIFGTTQAGALGEQRLEQIIQIEIKRFLEEPITFLIGSKVIKARRCDIGAVVDPTFFKKQLLAWGRSGDLVKDLLDRISARRGKIRIPILANLLHKQAFDFFVRLKEDIDRPPTPTRLDLDQRAIIPGADGYILRVYDCLAATELALHNHSNQVSLAVTLIHPPDTNDKLKKLDIGQVLGQFATTYSLADKDADRAHNLKVGASKLDGMVIEPEGKLSFNEVVGQRTEAEGYRVAPVIMEGELVDGMAGGACQLSSTLFSAAFFAGLDLVNSRPHTRPSSYIKMGLDAAVAYPGTDMVIRNPYPFPVIVHFKVNQGKVQVRILGKQRPWKRIVFEREVKETIPFRTETRESPSIPKGIQVVSQTGVPGFRLERRRLFYAEGKEPIKTEKRDIYYPPTTEYLLQGTGPRDLKWTPPKEHKPFGEVPAEFSLEQ